MKLDPPEHEYVTIEQQLASLESDLLNIPGVISVGLTAKRGKPAILVCLRRPSLTAYFKARALLRRTTCVFKVTGTPRLV